MKNAKKKEIKLNTYYKQINEKNIQISNEKIQ